MAQFILPEQYQRIFEAVPGAFLLLLPDAAFTIVGASDEYLRATMRQRAEVLGRPVFHVFPDNPETPDANSTLNLSRSLQRVVATREPDVMAVQRYDVPAAAGDGFEVRYWSPVNAPVFGEDGGMLCIVHRVDNVTEYVRLAEENARQRSMTEQLSADRTRMEAEIVERSLELDRLNRDLREAAQNKDEFLAMLAHELRNPLGAMSSALQLVAITRPDEPRYQGLLDVCRRQVKNLTRLVDDLLEMSRIDQGAVELQRSPLDLRDVVENAMHATRELFEHRKLTIATRIAPACFGVLGDATRLEQALTNLLTNASRYSEPGGNVELRLEPSPPGAGEGHARLEVRDEGRGIPPDKLEAIFGIFVQVDPGIDRARGGLGIGLPELDGFEVARRARAAVGHATKLVALTGYSTQVVRTAALDAGFDMYVTKPCTPAKLAEILAVQGAAPVRQG